MEAKDDATVAAEAEAKKSKKNKYRKDKPWDNDTIDHWKIEPVSFRGRPSLRSTSTKHSHSPPPFFLSSIVFFLR